MVSVVGKGGGILRQVYLKETNEGEPLRTCRKARNDVETGVRTSTREQGLGGVLLTAQSASGMEAA